VKELLQWWKALLPYSEQELLEREEAIWELEHADTIPSPAPERGAPEGSEW
jgi:hypothetical protein